MKRRKLATKGIMCFAAVVLFRFPGEFMQGIK